MFTPAIVPYISQFYPLGNTPAVSLTRGLPQGSDADILLLGCGDVRNILYTAYTERGFPSRRLDITCCDAEPSILARNILLLTLIIDGVSADDAWDIYFHLYISEGSKRMVKDQAAKLLGLSNSLRDWKQGAYGSIINFCDGGSLDLVKEVWSKYGAPDCTPAQFTKHLQNTREFLQNTHGDGEPVDMLTGLRSAAPLSVAAREVVAQAYKHFWEHGTFTAQPLPLPNPLFAATLSQNLYLHYATDPILGFHLATAFARLAPASPLSPDSDKDGVWRVIDAAKVQFRTWTSAFQDMSKAFVSLRFVVADALCFSYVLQCSSVEGGSAANIYRRGLDASPLILDLESYGGKHSAPTSFDIVDTSNLIDHLGALNILVASSPLLKNSARSILYTETLLKSSKTRKDQFRDLLCGHAPTVSLLIGLAPVDYWTNTTSISSVDELLINAVFSSQQKQQAHSRVAWRLAKHFPQNHRAPRVITAQASELASTIFRIYLQMFENEDSASLLALSREEIVQKLRSTTFPVYHRGSFAALMKCVQRNISTDWSSFWDELDRLNRLGGTNPASLNSQFGQEMGVQLHLQGVYSQKWLPVVTRPNTRMGCFDAWKSIPDLLCVTIIVPRKNIEHLYSTKPSKITAPTLNVSLKSPDWENYYSSMHVAFGDIETSGVSSSDSFSVSIRPDPRGWQGKSPMVVSIYAPTNALLASNPKDTQIGLNVQPTVSSIAKFRHIQPALSVYSTALLDKENVFFTKYMPGMSGYPAICAKSHPISPRDTDRDDVSKTSISAHFEDGEIKTLCGHVDFLSDGSKALLTEKAPIELRQSLPSSIDIVFGKDLLVCAVYFPIPVSKDQTKTRVARKSSYIEVIAPLADPIASESLSSFVYPITIDEQSQPILYNGNHVNLDTLPILSVDDRDKKANQWLVTLASHQYSLRERQLRKSAQGDEGISTSLRLNFKESLFTMFMLSSGLQGGTTGLFTLSHPEDGNQIIIFVRAIRIDGAAGSVVLDAAVLPLTQKLVESGEIGDFLLILRELQFCSINVNDEELILWKKVLPAFAERCRTWSHGSDCEYKKPGATIPLSWHPGEQFMCTCSNGQLPEQFMNIPEWDEASKYMVRAAISLTFSVPFIEDILDTQLLGLQGGVENLLADKCRNCNATEGKNGEKLLKCSRCKEAMYCSAECQKKDWKKHRMECTS
ncbi:MYND finger [Camillea tinctor]|nr:MYND finger [Camillea tinctor]